MQPLPSPTFVGYVPTLKCALARLRSSAPSTGLDARQYASPVHRAKFFSRRTSSVRRRPPGGESRRSALSTGLGWRRTSPAVCVCVVRDAAWRSIARLRRSAPSTGLDAGQYASPVHRAPFRSRRTSSARRRPPGGESRRSALSTGLGWRRTSPAVCVCVVRDAAWRSIARLRRSAPSTGLDAGQYASPVHRAPFRSRRTSSSGDPTAARRPSEPDIRPATAARRVHFKRGAVRLRPRRARSSR
jgi:hypothetical protein